MFSTIESLALINFIFCCVRTFWSFFISKRLIAGSWFLITYHSFFVYMLVKSGEIVWYKNFDGSRVILTDELLGSVCLYVTVFNLIFSFADSFIYLLVKPKKSHDWTLAKANPTIRNITAVYFLFLFGGAALYYFKMAGKGYLDYVDYAGSNWPIVFFWAAAPLITFKTLQKRYFQAFIACLPYLLFGYYLHVRSFVLLSLIPALVILIYQQYFGPNKKAILRTLVLIGISLIVLIGTSVIMTYNKQADTGGGKRKAEGFSQSLPDASLSRGMAIVFDGVNRGQKYTGLNSIKKYVLNIFYPFVILAKRFGIIDNTKIVDTPVHMARMIEGFSEHSKLLYHYPMLWYSDAYISFGMNGLSLAVLWAFVFAVWEAGIAKSQFFSAMSLPFYIWHNYMIIRGAVAGAAVPLSYAVYFAAIVAFVFWSLQKISSPFKPAKDHFMDRYYFEDGDNDEDFEDYRNSERRRSGNVGDQFSDRVFKM
ncbi:MAG: hypothetical protein GY874_03200 [Desulfobacteraceae bacterium]|nr:hypothetical protein [Desulfobacteraceae bacterium]